MSFVTAEERGVLPETEAISLELMCTNRRLPETLKPGDISQHTDSSPQFVDFRNIAPLTQSVLPPLEGSSKSANMSCGFCLYGLPDKRMEPLGQTLFQTQLPQKTLDRVTEACQHSDTRARHLYLVGGSMLDMAAEGERFVQIARRLHDAGLHERYYIACGTGAIPKSHMKEMKALGVRGACFNLEVWDPGGLPAGLYMARLRFRGGSSERTEVVPIGVIR